MKVCFITHSAPCGKGETFIINELNAIRKNFDILILPLRPRGAPQFEGAKMLEEQSIIIPLISFRIIFHFIISIFTNTTQVFSNTKNIFVQSRSMRVLVRNLCVLPKAIYASKILKDMDIDHIHCHWSCIQTTFGSIVANNLGIGFSFTAHSYDIAENNMLREKVKNSTFTRAISQNGKSQIIEFTGLNDLKDKIHVVHMGVKMPSISSNIEKRGHHENVIVCPANVKEIKGQRYLIEACAILKANEIRFKCMVVGDGPDIPKIKSLIKDKRLEGEVSVQGYYPHSKLMDMMRSGEIDIVVLPSITLEQGYSEGIPVALMEAMSYKIPVVSTNTGDISELLGEGCGIMVEQKNPKELSDAIVDIIFNQALRDSLKEKGFSRVDKEFNLKKSSQTLADLIVKKLNLG